MNILIAGLAKTGTTILFTRVRNSIKPEPATFFEPKARGEFDAILDAGKKRSTLSKSLIGHIFAEDDYLARFDRNILIVRDPRDQFISEMLYMYYEFFERGDRTGFLQAEILLKNKVNSPKSMSACALFREIREILIQRRMKNSPIRLLAGKYQDVARYRDAFKPFMVRYEDLIDDKLEALATYLGVSSLASAEVDRDVRRVKRSQSYGEWRQWLTADDVAEFEVELGRSMKEFGYLYESAKDSPVISPRTSLDYIQQFLPPV